MTLRAYKVSAWIAFEQRIESQFFMEQIARKIALLLLLMAGWFAHANVLAQSQPVFLRLKGVGVGSSVNGYGTDVQVVGSFAYWAWSLEWGGDTNHPGGLEIYCVTNPASPLRMGCPVGP